MRERTPHMVSCFSKKGSSQHNCSPHDHGTSTGNSLGLAQVGIFPGVPICCRPPSAISAIILTGVWAGVASQCPEWQSALANKDWSGETQLFCPACRVQSVLWRQDRSENSICSATFWRQTHLAASLSTSSLHYLPPLLLSINLYPLPKDKILSSGISLILAAPLAIPIASLISSFSAPYPSSPCTSFQGCSPDSFQALLQHPCVPPWKAPTAFCCPQGRSASFPSLPHHLHSGIWTVTLENTYAGY